MAKMKLVEQFNGRKLEFEAHDKIKPDVVADPQADRTALVTDVKVLELLKKTEEGKKQPCRRHCQTD